MNILRVTARWTGFTGAPGYSNFHFTSDAGFWDGGLFGDEAELAAESAAGRVRAAFDAIDQWLPTRVNIGIEPETVILDSDTGEIVGSVPVEVDPVESGGTSRAYSAASGAVVNWRTNDYRFGRRIRGRTFIVPLAGDAYGTDGTLADNALSSLRSFATTLIADQADPQFGVWSRPRSGAGGVFATAVSASVPDMSAVLRSRRD